MKNSIILGLIQNTALLLTLSLLYDAITIKYGESKSILVKVVTGIVLGAFGIILVLTPWTLSPGLVFDTRSIMLSISGLFFGPIPTIIAMVITGGYRIFVGGDGVYMGIAVIISSGTIGILWRKFRFKRLQKNNFIELLIMGLVVHIIMLMCTVFLPKEIIWETLKRITLPVIIIYPIGTMILGWIFIKRLLYWKAKKELQESEEKFRSLITSMDDLVFVFDKNKSVSYYHSPDISKLYVEPGKFYGKKISEFMPNDISLKFDEAFSKSQQNIPDSFEYNLEFGDKMQWFSLQLSPLFKDNEFDGALAIIREITELKQIEEAQQKSEKELSTLMDNLPGMAYSCLNDENWTMKFVSNGIVELTGYTPDEIIENKIISFNDIIHPDDREKVWNTVDSVLELKKQYQITYRIIAKNGDIKWVWEQGVGNYDSIKNSMLLEGYITDITYLRNTEDQLKERELLFQALMDNSPIYVFFKDENIRAIRLSKNYEQLLGMPLNDMLGKTMNDLFPSELAKKMIADDKKILNKRELVITNEEFKGRHYNTIKFPIIIDGNPRYLAGYTIDITENIQAQDEIKKLNAELEQRVIERTEELEATLNDVERMNKLFIGRELRIKELRDKIKELENKLK